MNIIERLLHFAYNEGISANKLSKQIEVSNAYFSKQKKNNGNIGSNIIEKIVRIYPNLNTDWLITGTGEMLKNVGNSVGGNNKISGNSKININQGSTVSSKTCECEKEVMFLKKEVELLKDKIKDKEEIIGMLKSIKA